MSETDEKRAKRLANLRPFQAGRSGNPGGRSKRDVDLRKLARSYTAEAVGALVHIVRNSRSSSARARAAQALLDRGWGKPVQPNAFTDIEGNDRLLPAEERNQLEVARRMAYVLAEGLRALPAPAQQPAAEKDSTNRDSDLHDPCESPDQSNTYSEEL